MHRGRSRILPEPTSGTAAPGAPLPKAGRGGVLGAAPRLRGGGGRDHSCAMKSPLNPGAPSEVVKSFFDQLMAGRVDLALQCWASDAVWHVTGGSSWAGDYSP